MGKPEFPKFTPEMIDKARKRLGVERPSRQTWHQATQDAIQLYATGIGDDNPLWLDEKYGKESVWGTNIAPPTFSLATFMSPLFYPSEAVLHPSGGSFPGIQGLSVGHQMIFHRPIKLGDTLSSTSAAVVVADADHRVPGDTTDPYADVERGLKAAADERAAYDGPMVLQVDHHKCFDAKTGELIAEDYENLIRIESNAIAPEQGKYRSWKKPRYSDADIAKIEDHYAEEAKNRRGGKTRFWEDVQVGDELPVLVKGPLTILSYIAFFQGHPAYFNLTDRPFFTFVRNFKDAVKRDPETNIPQVPEEMHWDPHIVSLVGMPIGFDAATWRATWWSHLATDWMGDDGFLNRFNIWFARPFFLYETAWLHGKVSRKEMDGPSKGLVHIDMHAVTQSGELLCSGDAVVTLKTRL